MSVPASERTPLRVQEEQQKRYSSQASRLSRDEDEENGHQASDPEEQDKEVKSTAKQAPIIAVLLLGIFIANVDGTLVIAQTGSISSAFGNFGNSEWLISVYFLATCAAQPIVGKLSDIFGRKEMLLSSYALIVVGNFLTGFASQMSLVSILIADLVPIRTVAAWRSYVNVAATTGRSVGGPIGGVFAGTISWRWYECFPQIA
ncbi:hypothetical protein MMC10_007556 [Thelotrema lepadinum]|nr:hypothetical protein [Thelotrema lepadinum]